MESIASSLYSIAPTDFVNCLISLFDLGYIFGFVSGIVFWFLVRLGLYMLMELKQYRDE